MPVSAAIKRFCKSLITANAQACREREVSESWSKIIYCLCSDWRWKKKMKKLKKNKKLEN